MNLKALFPHGSNGFFTANHQIENQIQPSESQPALADALGAKDKREKTSCGRVALRYRIFRVRPQDIDNAYGSTKQITDALVLSGLIQNDDPTQIKTTIEQEKVAHFANERI